MSGKEESGWEHVLISSQDVRQLINKQRLSQGQELRGMDLIGKKLRRREHSHLFKST